MTLGAVFFEESGGVFLGQAGGQLVMQVPGIVFGTGFHRQVRVGPAPGQIKEIDFKNRGLEEVLIFLDGGNHETPTGRLVPDLVE